MSEIAKYFKVHLHSPTVLNKNREVVDAEVLLVLVVPTVKKLLKHRHYVVVVVPLQAVVLIKRSDLLSPEQEFL